MSQPKFTFLNAIGSAEAKSGFVVSPAQVGQTFAEDFNLKIPMSSGAVGTFIDCDLLKNYPLTTTEAIQFPIVEEEGEEANELFINFNVSKDVYGISCSGTQVAFEKPAGYETSTLTTLQASTEASLTTYTSPVATGMTGGVNFSFVANQAVVTTRAVTAGVLGPYLIGGASKVNCVAAEITQDESGKDVETPVEVLSSAGNQATFSLGVIFKTTLNQGAKYAVTCPGASISFFAPLDLKSSYSYLIFGNMIETFPVKLETPTKTDDGTDGTDTSSSTVATTAAALVVAVSTMAAFFF